MEDSNLTKPIQPTPPVETADLVTPGSIPPAPTSTQNSAVITDEKFEKGPSRSLIILLVALTIIVLIGGVYMFFKTQAENSQKAAEAVNNMQALEEVNQLKNDLSGLPEEATSSEDLTQLEKDLSEL